MKEEKSKIILEQRHKKCFICKEKYKLNNKSKLHISNKIIYFKNGPVEIEGCFSCLNEIKKTVELQLNSEPDKGKQVYRDLLSFILEKAEILGWSK